MKEIHYLRTAEEITEWVNSRPAPNAEDTAKLRALLNLEGAEWTRESKSTVSDAT